MAQLRFYPKQIDYHRLQANGILLTDAEILHVQDSLQNAPPGRYSKDIYSVRYGIIKDSKGHLYAVYNEDEQFELGHGTFGATKLAQNLTTGEWFALKTQIIKQDNKKTSANSLFCIEHQSLSRLGKAHGGIIERDSKKTPSTTKVDMLIKLEKGVNLLDLINYKFFSNASPSFWPNLLWLNIAILALESKQNEKEEKISSLRIKDNTSFGTAGYAAPELSGNSRRPPYIYDEKTEIYAL